MDDANPDYSWPVILRLFFWGGCVSLGGTWRIDRRAGVVPPFPRRAVGRARWRERGDRPRVTWPAEGRARTLAPLE